MNNYCPACQKWHMLLAKCGDCPLAPCCCGEYFNEFKKRKTIPKAQAVLSYIEQKLEEARQAEKCKKWEPKLGDKVYVVNKVGHNVWGRGFTIVGRTRKNGLWVIFSPSWEDGHDGKPRRKVPYLLGSPVAGYPHSHWFVGDDEISPEDSK